MRNYSSQPFGTSQTPQVVKSMVFLTMGLSILAALFSSLLPLSLTFGLSLAGIQKGFFWQLLSYVFLQPSFSGISFSFLIHLMFNCYLLWMIGTAIVERSTAKQFLALYLLSALTSGLLAVGAMYLFGIPAFIGGANSVIYTLLISWMILYADSRISLFFVMPFQAKWLILGLLGANLLIDLSNHQWIDALMYISSSSFGYFFSVMKWKLFSPFSQLHNFERKLMQFSWTYRSKTTTKLSAKIFDFKTGKPVLSDEEFMDEMLAKISSHGEEHLSEKEKARMNEIAGKTKNQEKV